ncbi:hypothetical protein F7731_09420 [Cytobacillus depressus]|uniref:Conjugal transfer protein TraX n=1 Tax=Cytobacillus depressus TaxID=1602942 RepID=A0A6L3V7K6_9BACI|nr:TraX family protein [Cytobacillus depressus]KAB2336577.1 hypothetical protein F7731_09420 [Cytobacillus depressus]
MTTTMLKIIALILMVLDHIGLFIPNTPELLRWLGRIAAPIFIFGVAIGFKHTSNHKKYLFRLYVAGFLMSFINLYFNSINAHTGVEITNNFFTTLFLLAWLLFLIEHKKIKYYVYFLLWQIVSTIFCVLFSEILVIYTRASHYFYGSIFGNLFFVEGGITIILLGVLFYLSKTKIQLSVSYSAYCLFLYIATERWGGNPGAIAFYLFPFAKYQWIMIFALPIMLLYNGKKGVGMKYFFYLFYPIHIIVLYLIGISLI